MNHTNNIQRLMAAVLLSVVFHLSGVAQFEQIQFTTEAEILPPAINSIYADAEPKLSPDGNTLYFCRRENDANIGNADIWQATLVKQQWTNAVNLGRPANDEGFNQVAGIRSDGNALIIFNMYNYDIKSNIFISFRQGKTWGKPEAMTIENFGSVSSVGVSADFQTLIISAPAYNGGSDDLFVCHRKDKYTWTTPINIGKAVNTPGSERCPTLAGDGKTLYFSSDGREGYGSYDLYMTKRQDSTWTKWTTPINMGNKLNGQGYDADFTVDAMAEYAYFSSNFGSTSGVFNIYRIKLPNEARPEPVVMLQGKVINKKTATPLEVEVNYYRLSDGKKLGTAYSNAQSGGYKIVLPYGERYSITATREGFAAISDYIDLTKVSTYTTTTKDLYLVPLEVGGVVRMNNIFFATGKNQLSPDSYLELNNVVALLNSNKTLEIEIGGHTDNVGSAETNLKLSGERAIAVAEYLKNKGIAATRLRTKGYGKDKPLTANSTEAGRQQNRRVEFTILKK